LASRTAGVDFGYGVRLDKPPSNQPGRCAINRGFGPWWAATVPDEIGRVDAIAKAAEAELKALKDEFKARGLDCAEGLVSTVTASEVFKNTLDMTRIREALGDHVKQFETLMVSTVIRIKPTRRLEVLAAA
jgi:hypothetical protein